MGKYDFLLAINANGNCNLSQRSYCLVECKSSFYRIRELLDLKYFSYFLQNEETIDLCIRILFTMNE